MPGVLSSDDLPSVPTPLSPLVGRVRECAALTELLARGSVRLLTLTGPGGVGKTRLALQVAADLADHFADGVAFVSLAALTDAEQVPIAIAQVCGLREGGGAALTERLRAYLRDRQRLLLLDNFEQVVEAAPLLVDLLVACPGVKLLVTSRTSLRVTGEQEFHVQPLALPDATPPITAERAIESAAVTLFVQRVQSAQPDFVVTPDNAPTLTEICHRLDGIPLAIELAAARVRVLSPPALLGRLGRRLPLLTGGARDAPVRLQTMRGAIAWSYDLLDAGEQALFRRLAVFAGGFSLDAAEAVCRGRESGARGQGARSSSLTPDSRPPTPDILDGLASLVDKSLVRQAAPANGEPRYRILETIREHGLERLETASEEGAVRDAHAAVYLALAEEAETHLARAVEPAWLDRLDAEHDNLRAALAWLAARGDAGRLLRLDGALWLYWYYHGHLSEGRRWIEAGLAIPAAATDPARAWRCCGWLRPG